MIKITKKQNIKVGLAQAVTFGFSQIVRIFFVFKKALLSLKNNTVNQFSFKAEQRQKSTAGFTLVELLVTLSIFVIVSGIVLFNQGKFNGSIVLTNLAYDVALGIREAQIFGVSGKVGQSDITKKPQYGVYFVAGSDSAVNTQFKLFSDLDNSYYYSANDQVLENIKITRGNYVSGLSYFDGDNNKWIALDNLSIVFRRPDPEAYFYKSDGTKISTNQVKILLSPQIDPASVRSVIVTKIGLIYVNN
jgi:prepilin-type N-terminal cleavage/methylation domain-containing protein